MNDMQIRKIWHSRVARFAFSICHFECRNILTIRGNITKCNVHRVRTLCNVSLFVITTTHLSPKCIQIAVTQSASNIRSRKGTIKILIMRKLRSCVNCTPITHASRSLHRCPRLTKNGYEKYEWHWNPVKARRERIIVGGKKRIVADLGR